MYAQPDYQITKGEWYVREVLRVDEDNRQIYFSANGMEAGEDPYLIRYYRIGFDGKGLTCLTPEEGMHRAWFSGDMKYLVDVYSMVDKVPVAVLRSARDGKVVMPLENTSTEQSASGYEVKDTSLTCYVNSEKGLNVRSGPSTDYSVIGTLSNGSKIEVTGESGGWYRFDYNGKDGFVATKYTTTQATDPNGSNAAAADDNSTSSTAAADGDSESKLAIFDDSTLTFSFPRSMP